MSEFTLARCWWWRRYCGLTILEIETRHIDGRSLLGVVWTPEEFYVDIFWMRFYIKVDTL